MELHEPDHVAEAESALAALRSVVVQPSPIRIPADRRWDDAQKPRTLFEREFRIEQAANEFFARFFEFAPVVVAGGVIFEIAHQKFDVAGERLPHRLQGGVDAGGRLSRFRPSGPGCPHFRLSELAR